MSSLRLTSSSDQIRSLAQLAPGESGVVIAIDVEVKERFDHLVALGVTPGASVTVLQVFPGVVFMCDQTELAVERGVAAAIHVTHEGGALRSNNG